jgi:hypothetical protein
MNKYWMSSEYNFIIESKFTERVGECLNKLTESLYDKSFHIKVYNKLDDDKLIINIEGEELEDKISDLTLVLKDINVDYLLKIK